MTTSPFFTPPPSAADLRVQARARLALNQITVIRFDTVGRGRHRGYDIQQVNGFVAWVQAVVPELDRLRRLAEDDARSLRHRIDFSEARPFAIPADAAAVQTLAQAQLEADGIVRRAHEYARQREQAARQHYEQVIAQAHQLAKQAADAAVPPMDEATASAQQREVRERERAIAYLQTFVQVLQVACDSVAALQAAAESSWEGVEAILAAGRAALRATQSPHFDPGQDAAHGRQAASDIV
jgi:cell division septum initiation protein DivIVA